MSKIYNLDLRRDDHFQAYAMDNVDCQYVERLKAIREYGTFESDPARSEDTWSVIPSCTLQLRNTAMAFPMLLSKKVNGLASIDETCWFARGETNINTLNSKIWDEWADDSGECGPIYGEMWRRYPDVKVLQDCTKQSGVCPSADSIRVRKEIERMRAAGYRETALPDGRILFEGHIDQLLEALISVKNRSRSRRIKVEAWNPAYIHMQGLPPCHTGFEFNVTKSTEYERRVNLHATGNCFEDSLHITATMRSADTCLGTPFNIVGYTALLHLFAKYCDLNIGSMTLNTSNTHVYTHHWEGVDKQLDQYDELIREVRKTNTPMQYPILRINDCIMSMTPEEMLSRIDVAHFSILEYNPKDAIKFRVTK